MKDKIIKEKKLLRKILLEARENISPEEARTADNAILSRVLNAGFYREAESVFIYVSVDREMDTKPVIHQAFKDGKTVLVPRTGKDRTMEAVLIDEEEFLKRAETEWPRCFNIPEPPDDLPALDPARIDLVIVPSLALDLFGYRLGYGGGFYDHFIAAAHKQKKRPVFVAVQRAAFIRDDALPREPYDMAVDYIVSENGISIPVSSV